MTAFRILAGFRRGVAIHKKQLPIADAAFL